MTDNTGHIDYDLIVQDALRGVVRSVLQGAEENGLRGEHHFYIAFKTRAAGVQLPDHLRARFPDEMTIVLQHKFWGLRVRDADFEVGLSFNQQPELLVIPFAAVVGFVDPSVQFALQFNEDSDLSENDLGDGQTLIMSDSDDETIPDSNKPAVTGNTDSVEGSIGNDDNGSDDGDGGDTGGGDNVVTLDAFRKK